MKGLLLLGVLSSWACCRCAEPTNEESLRERLDTTEVHLYLASKIAIDREAKVDVGAQRVAIRQDWIGRASSR